MPVSHDLCTVPATPQDITTFTLASAVIGYKVWVKLDVDTTNRILSLAALEVFGKGLHALYGHTISLQMAVSPIRMLSGGRTTGNQGVRTYSNESLDAPHHQWIVRSTPGNGTRNASGDAQFNACLNFGDTV